MYQFNRLYSTLAAATTQSLAPATRTTTAGDPRRVGVEIEFAGLELNAVADLVASVFGGRISYDTDYEITIADPELGKFRAEVDFGLLKRIGQERVASEQAPGTLEQVSEELLAALARQLVPCEIVTPPLPIERLDALDRLIAKLREAGAKGTDDALLYAFGVHFNVEAPSLRALSILRYLRAFALLYDWLLIQLKVDSLRRLSPFIKPFPSRYLQLILQTDYRPTRATLIADYLTHNPTRNRALDMLPLFAFIDPQRVFAAIGNAKVCARPAYHYRLSNSFVGNPLWRISNEWRYWLLIEALAEDKDRLRAMADDYLSLIDRPLGDLFSEWGERTEIWLQKPLQGKPKKR